MGCFQQLGAYNVNVPCHSPDLETQRSHLPSTPYDNAIDRLSINPKFQAFEKFISGMYLGEIVRNVMLSLVDSTPQALLFGGKSAAGLNKHYGIDTSFMSAVEEAWIGDNSSDLKDFEAPPFHEDYSKETLSPKVAAKLEDICSVIVKFLGFDRSDVSLKDAGVRSPYILISA